MGPPGQGEEILGFAEEPGQASDGAGLELWLGRAESGKVRTDNVDGRGSTHATGRGSDAETISHPGVEQARRSEGCHHHIRTVATDSGLPNIHKVARRLDDLLTEQETGHEVHVGTGSTHDHRERGREIVGVSKLDLERFLDRNPVIGLGDLVPDVPVNGYREGPRVAGRGHP